MSTPKAAAEIQAARARQYRRKVEPLPVPADRPVRLLSVEEIRAYEAEIRARPPKANRSLPR